MITAGDLYDAIDRDLAPFSSAASYDNSGLLIGSENQPVSFCLLALDLTRAVCEEAAERGAQAVVTHHPVIFDPVYRIPKESVLYPAIQAGIAVISAHTNLDAADGGVTDTLVKALGFGEGEILKGSDGCGRICKNLPLGSEALTGVGLARRVKERLSLSALRLYDAGNPIRTVAFCSGAGGSLIPAVLAAGADAYITGDVKHNQAVEAANLGLTLIDAGHYETEEIVLEPLRRFLSARFPQVLFERAQTDEALMRFI